MVIIKSLLDTDFYKFTQMQAVLHNYPSAMVRYEFKWRNLDQMHLQTPLSDFIALIKEELDNLCKLRMTPDEINYLSSIPYFKLDFIEYLRMFQLNRSYIRVYECDKKLKIVIEGPWVSTILFEVPVLAIVSELYTKNGPEVESVWIAEGRRRFENKFAMLDSYLFWHKDSDFKFADFGTRRRVHRNFHEEIISKCTRPNFNKYFIGTSNVDLARRYGLKPIGTMAHEWIQAHQQLGPRLVDSQKAALQAWANEYRGELGIALSDCLGFQKFLKDFDRYFALLFDGCRHDSGDPVRWCENLIKHYEKLRINPKTKSAVFSDGLNFETAIDLHKKFSNLINVSFGIGTYLTNDCGFTAPQVVIKMVECNGKPVAKISDSPGKGMCENENYNKYLKEVVGE